MKPVLHMVEIKRESQIKDALQTDEALLSLLDKRYTVATSFMLLDGPEGEARQLLCVYLVPPFPAQPRDPPVPMALPAWARWWAGLVVVLLVLLIVGSVLTR